MRERRSTLGLACAGGVVEGAIYEIGALCALEDAVEGLDFTRLGVYVGVSSGALVAAALANGIHPRTLSRALLGQADASLSLRPEVLFAPAFGEYAQRLRRLPGVLGSALAQYARNPFDLSPVGVLAELGRVLPVGFFDSAPFEAFLASAFSGKGRTNDFRDLDAVLRVVAVNLDTSEVVAFGDAETAHVPISKAVQASTALPVLYNPVEIDGQPYIDGVARRTVHASQALEAGAELLFCINPIVPVDVRRRANHYLDKSLAERGLPAVLSQTFRTLVHSRMRTGFQKYEHLYPDAEIVLIEPAVDDYEVFFSNLFSLSKRRTVAEHAYRATRRYLREHADTLAPMLDRHGLRLRRAALDGEGELFPGEAGRPASLRTLGGTLDRLDAALARLQADPKAA